MKKQVGAINVAPTPEGYAACLITIIESSTKPEDREWAKPEIIKAFQIVAQTNLSKWGRSEPKNKPVSNVPETYETLRGSTLFTRELLQAFGCSSATAVSNRESQRLLACKVEGFVKGGVDGPRNS